MSAEVTPSVDLLGPRQPHAPFVKWVGGKRSLLPEILARAPENIDTYYEPFVGGGAVFFALASENRFKSAVISDVNREIVTTYQVVREHLDDLIQGLHCHAALHSEEYYYKVRAAEHPDPVYTAARFVYLNKAGFNGLYRVNRVGQFNVPFGKNPAAAILDEDRLRAASVALQGVTIECCDFCLVSDRARSGDFVYFDPPYVPVSKTSSFTAYSVGGFSWKDQEELAELTHLLGSRGVKALLSNADCAETRALYKGLKIESVSARRAINSKASKRGPVGELLVSNWEGA